MLPVTGSMKNMGAPEYPGRLRLYVMLACDLLLYPLTCRNTSDGLFCKVIEIYCMSTTIIMVIFVNPGVGGHDPQTLGRGVVGGGGGPHGGRRRGRGRPGVKYYCILSGTGSMF